MYRIFGKRLLDIVGSLSLLAVFSPILLVVAVALFVQNRGKLFFVQWRPGLNGVLIPVLKFRTMTDCRDAQGRLLPDEERVTWLGGKVRSLSLDEFPQLLNVLRGEMSLIGPRPQLAEFYPLYSPAQRRRHEVKPGLTGLAQVKGRNRLSWEKRFRYDVFYVDHLSFILDVKILLLTVVKVLQRDGVEYEQSVEESKFRGSRATRIVESSPPSMAAARKAA